MSATVTCPAWCARHVEEPDGTPLAHRSVYLAESDLASIIIEQQVSPEGATPGEMFLYVSGQHVEAELRRTEALAFAEALILGAKYLAHYQGVELEAEEQA